MMAVQPVRAALLMALGALMIGTATVATTRPATALTNCTASTAIDSEEQAFLSLINNYRAQNGLNALTISEHLTRSATWMATDMGAKNYFSHTDSLGRSPSDRARDCDYPTGAGENIAAGTAWDTAQEVFTAWRNSSGHNANMLHSSYRQIGIARVYTSGSRYGWYWATEFGTVNDGSSGGGAAPTATPSPTPTQPPPTAAPASPATISSPAPGSTLSGSSTTFSWAAAQGAQQYFVYVGTARGSNNIYGGSTGTNRSVTVSNLPADGRTLHVRLWTRFASGWQYRDATYTASNAAAGATTTKSSLTSPAPGSTLPGSRVTFRWSQASGAQEYFFYLGTSPGSNNMWGRSMGTGTSVTLQGLPTDGRTLWVRIWTRTASGWAYNDHQLQAAP